MAILAYLTDNQNLEAIIKKTKEINAHYILTFGLNLIGETKKHYFNFLKKEYPELVKKYYELFTSSQRKKEYNAKLYPLIKKLKEKHKVSSNYNKAIKEKLVNKDQMKMFE